jgi:hypothetical protein
MIRLRRDGMQAMWGDLELLSVVLPRRDMATPGALKLGLLLCSPHGTWSSLAAQMG